MLDLALLGVIETGTCDDDSSRSVMGIACWVVVSHVKVGSDTDDSSLETRPRFIEEEPFVKVVV